MKNIEQYNRLGLECWKAGNHEKALEAFERGKEASMGLAWEEIRKEGQQDKLYVDKTTADGKKVMEIQPGHWEIVKEHLKRNKLYARLCYNEARVCMEMGRYDDAKEQLKDAIELTPDGMEFKDPIIALKELEETNKRG